MPFLLISSGPRPGRPVVLAVGAAPVATIAIGASACSRGAPAATAPPVATEAAAAPTSPGSPTPSASGSTAGGGVAAVHLARSTPLRVKIAAIGVNSPLMDLGLQADGSLEVPPSGFPAGWYTGGPTPGQLGPAVIAGHIDWNGPGVFFRLHDLKPGDEVTVTRADGSTPVFRVTRVAQFPKDQFPTQLVYGNIDYAGLRLITCGGSFNSRSGHYEDNIIVFANLVNTPQ